MLRFQVQCLAAARVVDREGAGRQWGQRDAGTPCAGCTALTD